MSNPMTASRPPQATSLMTVIGSVLAAIPLVTVVMWFVLVADGPGDFPASWSWLVLLAAAAGAYSICELAGFRTAPLPPGGDSAEVERQSWQRFTSSTFVRFAVCEAVFVLSLPIAFIVQSFWVVLIGAVLAMALLAWEVWPGPRNARRFAASLESAGHPSYLLGRRQDHY